jgi:transcriptional regulator with XRE-family HTH domain
LTSTMRMLRTIRGISLNALGAQLGYTKGSLSSLERFPHTAGPKARKSLQRFWGLDWALLSAPITGDVVASALVNSLTKAQTK